MAVKLPIVTSFASFHFDNLTFVYSVLAYEFSFPLCKIKFGSYTQVQWSPHNETILASSGTDRRLHVWDLRYRTGTLCSCKWLPRIALSFLPNVSLSC